MNTGVVTLGQCRVVVPPVDPLLGAVPGRNTDVVVYSEATTVYDTMLNQTSVQENQNKFYTMQLLKEKLYDNYYVWYRWGRIGENGAHALKRCGANLVQAKALFEEKFFQKTGNRWAERRNFTKRPGMYQMIKREHCEQEDPINFETFLRKAAESNVECTLSPNLQRLISLISDVKTMEKRVTGMHFDSQKMPLGTLQREQIDAGYKALRRIEDCISNSASRAHLTNACDEFYMCIPHQFRRSKPPEVINTNEQVQEKMQLLQALEDIRKALEVYNSWFESQAVHPYELFYASLGCKVSEVDCQDSDYKSIELAVKNTHGATHKRFTMSVQHVFRVCRPSEERQFTSKGNHRMLWHGSMASNFTGILCEGLCIAPPHVPVNGYMFGKGVYFADSASKSANYCRTQTVKSKEGVLALCEVSLGEEHVLQYANPSASSLPPGKHSVKGQGRFSPDPAGDFVMKDGATLACGTLVENKEVRSSLIYNEYIVYDTSQIKIRYLVKFQFQD